MKRRKIILTFKESIVKNIYMLAVIATGLCGSLVSGYADDAVAPKCATSSDQEAFMAKLSDVNKALFCAMTEAQRTDCMKMTQQADSYGNKMMPDEAVQNMSATGGCAVQ